MTGENQNGRIAVRAADVPARVRMSGYPQPFRSLMENRVKQPLGDFFGLSNFGVNRTELKPGGISSLLHRHSRQDEFIYILDGDPVLVTDEGEVQLAPGMCAGFKAGGIAHQLVNRTSKPVVYLEIGDRTPGDEGSYPADDLKAVQDPEGCWIYLHKDGRPY